MGKIIEQKIDNFSGGIADDPRSSDTRFCSMVKHFNTDFPHKLIPYPKIEVDETVVGTPKDGNITKFMYAPTSGGNYRLYGYGEKISGTTEPAIFLHDADLTATGWVAAANGESAQTARNEDVFFHYKNYLYGWSTGELWRYGDLTSSPTMTDQYQTISFTNVAQPVHHPADDIAYFFSDNKVHTLNSTTWASTVQQVPDNLKITSGAAYGNYLAIGCASLSGAEESTVFLWDRDTSSTTFSEKISLGSGDLKFLAVLNGQLVAVMDYYLTNASNQRQGKVVIKKIIGNQAYTIREILTDDTSSKIYNTMTVKEDKLYFPAALTNDGDTNLGIWGVDVNGKATMEAVEEDATAATSFQGIYNIGNVWWIAHSNDGSIGRSDDNLAYTYKSIYETLIITGGDSSISKKLLGVTVMTEPLPAAGQIVLKYRTDGDIDDGTVWDGGLTLGFWQLKFRPEWGVQFSPPSF